VTATYDTTTGAVSLTAADGRNITLEKAATAVATMSLLVYNWWSCWCGKLKTVAGEIA
jgi:hypothetical protein